jgi:exodeoxyribonuclease VIII
MPDDYFARPGVNWSRLKLARTSVLHYRDTPDRPDTAALGMLRAVHAMVLEPDYFDRDFVVWTGATRRGKVWDAFKEQHADRTILNEREYREASKIATAVLRYPPAEILEAENARTEVPLYWTDERTGLECKGKADIILEYDDYCKVVDLKTVRSVNPRQMASDCARMGYHGQLAHYAAGVEAVTGKPVVSVGLLCVEGTAPHDVGLFWLDVISAEVGRALRDDLLSKVGDASREQYWPGQVPEATAITLPAWALDEAHRFDDDFTGGETDA